jgi:fructose-1,6-bisphosphatase I
LGSANAANVQGEIQQKLDVYANEMMIGALRTRTSVGILASEENEKPIAMAYQSAEAKYAVVFDPLDGSSNIDVNVSVGTTFSIFRRPEGAGYDDPTQWVLQPGRRQIAAGYIVYGSSTVMVYTVGSGVHGFTLDPAVGAYVLSHENIRMPRQGNYYSVNEAYRDNFPENFRDFIHHMRSGQLNREYSSRYIGSMVADFHRTLLRGGVFMYPPTASHASGKLRLLYEANPIAMLAEQAGGLATDSKQRILDIHPVDIHQRTPLIVGSQVEMTEFQQHFSG